MDPLAIVSTLKALINRVQWAFHAIESVEQAEAAEIDALRELETALSVVESDISLFKTTISALQSPENDHFYSAFTQQYAKRSPFLYGKHYKRSVLADRVPKKLWLGGIRLSARL